MEREEGEGRAEVEEGKEGKGGGRREVRDWTRGGRFERRNNNTQKMRWRWSEDEGERGNEEK